jgi:diaminopimelate epimerase
VCLSSAKIAELANRKTGIGCDQLVVIEPGDAKVEAVMRIYNADGSEVSACGNATRCVARLLMEGTGKREVLIKTRAGILHARRAEGDLITADMGPALLDWQQIPLAEDKDTLCLPIMFGEMLDPVAVSMGNPHAVFFVDDAEAVDLPSVGPMIETHPLFPEQTNVEAVSLLGKNRLRMRVWERGVGITEACGTGACATVVAAARRGLTDREAEVVLDGGSLHIVWDANNHVLMTGPATLAYTGVIAEI